MLAPDADQPELGSDLQRMNNFLYADPGNDRGLRCPLGAHIRRMNPRDTPLPVMTDVRLHRIIRHGTAYGPPLPDGVFDDDGQARGIFFIFLSATAPDTYEFLKKHWIDDGNFLGLGTERDPICGSHDGTGQFTIPMRPLRRKIPMLESFTRTLGRRVRLHAQPERAALAQRARHLALVDRELVTWSLVPSRAQVGFEPARPRTAP